MLLRGAVGVIDVGMNGFRMILIGFRRFVLSVFLRIGILLAENSKLEVLRVVGVVVLNNRKEEQLREGVEVLILVRELGRL